MDHAAHTAHSQHAAHDAAPDGRALTGSPCPRPCTA